ncbi:MAG: DUF305 domain-containing protein [Caulobacter segnis]|uniref:DUF305 domain-containing protein n=2 Tax=Caulobacter segnis TaxID=88688 RepID=A0A2W5UVA9_9CAUL|nr:DUF305 domain-containing protein [Caulobacter segnis]PZR30922.1 MAG: DUF305 domain-containing protein [Caulobacter segnis]
MITASTLVMFGLMYLNTYEPDHLRFSQTRAWMALMMSGVMAALMIGFMWGMYRNKRLNAAILCGSLAIAVGALAMVRSQATVGDVAYLEAMIPHHSIAIMTSERARLRDPQTRALADGILDAQLREIEQMKQAVARLKAAPPSKDAPVLASYRARHAAPPPPQTDASTGIDTLAIPR